MLVLQVGIIWKGHASTQRPQRCMSEQPFQMRWSRTAVQLRHGSDTLSVPNAMLCPPLCQIRVERTSDRDLVLFAEDVFLSIEGHGVSASESARLLRGRQAPRGSISGTQQPHMRRFSMTRVAPSVRNAGSCMPSRYPQSPSHRCDCCLQ